MTLRSRENAPDSDPHGKYLARIADPRLTDFELETALRRAYGLGQQYWQQADSEYISQYQKADATRAKFEELISETVAKARGTT